MSVLWQVAGTSIACLICLNLGIIFTWPSSTLMIFESSNTTLTRPMGPTELALFSSLSSIGALMGVPMAAYCLDKIGRKWSAIISSLMYVLAWAMIASSNIVEVVLFAIFLSGLGGGAFLIVPVFVSEFCQESIRGSMMSGAMVFYSMGMLISYVLGGFLEYKPMTYTCLSICVLGTLLLGLMKESPSFLMQRGLDEEAKESIAFYRSVKIHSKVVLEEMNAIRRALNPDMEDSQTDEEDKLGHEKPKVVKPKEQLSLFQFIRKSRSTKRALFVCMVLVMSSILQGLVVLQVYAEPLFEEALPHMSPTLSSVIFAMITVVSGFGTAYLSDVVGRKALMVYASAVAAASCVVLGTQLHLKWAPHAFTAICLYVLDIALTMGGGTIPYVYAAEVFLPEVKSFVTMMVVETAWLCNFIILFIFNPLVSAVGLGPVFYIFGAVCFSTAVFCLFCMPETKGLAVDGIQELFSYKKSKNSNNGV